MKQLDRSITCCLCLDGVTFVLRHSLPRLYLTFLGVLCVFVVHSSSFGQTTRPAIVTAQEWGSKPQPIPEIRRHTPKFVTIHHAGVLWKADKPAVEFVRNMQSWGQREKNWPDLPYHFLIAPDGTIFEGRPLVYEPDTNTRYVLAGNIGVEMMGDFNRQRPSARQLESCVQLTAWLCQELKIDPANIRGHNDAAPGQTSCPGMDFYRYLQSGEFVGWVKSLLDGRPARILIGPPLTDGPTEIVPQ